MDSRRTFRYGLTGCADIVGISRPGGRFIAIEAKVGDDVQRSSQSAFQRMVEAFGGVYVLAYSVEEAEETLRVRLGGPPTEKHGEGNARHDRLENPEALTPE